MRRILEYQISGSEAGLSVESFLKSKGYTRQSITQMKKCENNTVIDGEWVHVNHKLKEGDRLVVTLYEDSSSEKIPPVKLPFQIVYEDEDIMVVDKPANMPIHPSLNNYENSLGNAIEYYFQSMGQSHIFRCINRLDRDTTGLTIIAKHFLSAGILHNAMRSREIKREYLAVVDGIIEADSGRIDAAIARIDGSTIERHVDEVKGERAVTNYRVVKRMDDMTLIALRLETGRTHQIRVHMKHIGHPLIGDFLYNPADKRMARQALHSYRLEFVHPITFDKMEFEAKLPEDMRRLLPNKSE